MVKPSHYLQSAWPATCPGSEGCSIKGLQSPEARLVSASPPALRGVSSPEQLQVSTLCFQVNPIFISIHSLKAVRAAGAKSETLAGMTCTAMGGTEGRVLASYTLLKIRDGNVSSRKLSLEGNSSACLSCSIMNSQ